MGLHQVAHLRIDALLDLLLEQQGAGLFEIGERPAAQDVGGLVDEGLELDATELVVERGGDHADGLADPHIAIADSFPGEDDAGEAGHQRAVEVEEGPDLGSSRTGQNLGHRTGKLHFRSVVVVDVVTHGATDPFLYLGIPNGFPTARFDSPR